VSVDPGTQPMKGLVEVIARALVDDPAPVEVLAAGTADEPVFRLRVGKDDLGKVIGKKGRTAKAFRTLIAAAAAKQDLRPTVEILEPDRPRRAPDGSPAPSAETAAAAEPTSSSSESAPEAPAGPPSA
jgi:predicted RNA-binding protein YlqC (UPF0109 family)